MKTKTSCIAAVIACMAFSTLHAQQNKVVSAKMHLDEYNQDPTDTSDLNKAKADIDLAVVNPKTSNEAKMWLYRGNVYRAVFEKDLALEVKKQTGGKGATANKNALMAAYVAIDTTPISIAAYSYMQVIKLEPGKAYAEEALAELPVCAAHIENKATSDFNSRKYASALAMFEKAILLGYAEGEKDKSAFIVQNNQNCAITADNMHDNKTALYYYQKLVNMKAGGAHPYSAMISIYSQMNDTTHEMEIIKKGLAAFPSDVNLLISQTNYYLQTGNTNKAIDNLQTTITKVSQQNKKSNDTLLSRLYFVLGNAYDRMANPKNDSGIMLPKPANYTNLFTNAQTNYQSALAITPGNFDENYDLGALYNNRATEINKQANDLPLNETDKFNKLQAEANVYLKDAQPWLEKAHSINPQDQPTINALKQIYASTNQTDKIKGLMPGK